MAKPAGANSFVRQASILAGASIFVRLLGFAYRIPLTNSIGDAFNAYYVAAYNVYTLALTISSGAMIAAISRLTSERIAQKQYRNAHKLFKTAMGLAMTLGAIVAILMYLGAEMIAEFFNLPGMAHSVRALAPAVFFVSMLAVFRGYFQGMKTSMPTALSQVIEQIFKVGFSVWLAFLFFDAAFVEFAAAGAAAGTVISVLAALGVVIMLYALIAKDLRQRALIDFKKPESRIYQIAVILRTSLPMIIGVGLVSLGNFLDLRMATDRIYASGAYSEEEIRVLVGQFTGKFILLTTLPVSLSMALSAAVIPEITSSKVTLDDAAVRDKTHMAMRLSMIISIPAAVGLSVLADPIVALLFPNHPDGGWLLRYGAISIVFLAMTQILTGVLQGIGRVGIPAISMFFGVLVKIPVNYVLMAIPSINILGAVISTIVCFAVAGLLNIFFLYRFTGILPEIKSMFIKPSIAAAGMGIVCFAVYYVAALYTPNAVSTIAALIAGGFSYLILMVMVKGFKPADLAALPLPRGLRRMMRG